MALHQKQDKHHFWLKRQMQSLLVDVNRIRNLATKNAFVAHETCRRSWKSLTLLSAEADLQDDGFNEIFQFDSTPRNDVLRRTPSLEDSEYSSSAATVHARVINDEDDATSPPPTTTARIDTAPSSSAPPTNDDNPAASPTHEDE